MERDSGAGKEGSGGGGREEKSHRLGFRFFSWRLLPRTVRESGREEGGCQLGFYEISGC